MPDSAAVPDAPVAFHPASSLDYLPRETLRGLQSERLRRAVAAAYGHMAFYRQRMHKHGLSPAAVLGVDDLEKLPFTLASDLSDAFPTGALAVPLQQVARVQVLGVAGKRALAAHTRRDLESWTGLLVRSLASCGVHEGDVLLNALGHQLFPEALALQCAAEALGASAVAGAGADVDHQVLALKEAAVSVVCSTPAHFLYLAGRAGELGVDLAGLPLRVGVFAAEAWSDSVRRKIEDAAGIRACALYGLPEIVSPGVGAECCRRDGLHVFEDCFYPEIVDPASGRALADGEEGELAVTALAREAVPLVRYRTGELAAIVPGPCPCGRTTRRVRRTGRRGEEACVVEGVEVFPSQIEAALLAAEGKLPEYRIARTREQGRDRIEVQIEVTPEVFSDQVGAMERLQNRLARQVEAAVGVRVPVRFVEPRRLRRGV